MPKFRKVISGKKAKTTAVRVNSKVGGRKSKNSVKTMSNVDLIKEHEAPKRPRDKNKVQKEFDYRFAKSETLPS